MKFTAGIFVLIHFIGYTLIIVLFDLHYPNVVFISEELEFLDKVIIRIFASYSYYETSLGFWTRFIICSSILSVLLCITLFKFPNQLKKLLFQWVGVYGIINYLYWVFSVNRSKDPKIINFIIPNQFFQQTLIFFSLNLGIFLLFFMLNIFRGKIKQIPVEITNLPSTIFECPHCHSKFLSKVQYCSSCNKLIESEK